MTDRPSSSPHAPKRLLAVERVRALAGAQNPDYGRDFSDAEWERITERLEALARLMWRVSLRQTVTQPQRPRAHPAPGSNTTVDAGEPP